MSWTSVFNSIRLVWCIFKGAFASLASSLSTIRRTKIVATLGPAWEHPEQMRALLDAGVDVVRINSSHGTPEVRARWITDLQQIQRERPAAFALLVDLQGPR